MALPKLLVFIMSPIIITCSDLKVIPGLYHVVKHEMQNSGVPNAMTIVTCKWLYKVAYVELKSLEKYGYPQKEAAFIEEKNAWQKVSLICCSLLRSKILCMT